MNDQNIYFWLPPYKNPQKTERLKWIDFDEY